MAHVRKQIRDAVAGLLSAAPVEWKRVFASKTPPDRDVLPYLLVYVDSGDYDTLDIHSGHRQQRDYDAVVSCRTRLIDGEDLENKLDAMAAEVESTLTFSALNTALGGKLRSLELVSDSSDNEVQEGESRTIAEIVLNWRVRVVTIEGNPETLV